MTFFSLCSRENRLVVVDLKLDKCGEGLIAGTAFFVILERCADERLALLLPLSESESVAPSLTFDDAFLRCIFPDCLLFASEILLPPLANGLACSVFSTGVRGDAIGLLFPVDDGILARNCFGIFTVSLHEGESAPPLF